MKRFVNKLHQTPSLDKDPVAYGEYMAQEAQAIQGECRELYYKKENESSENKENHQLKLDLIKAIGDLLSQPADVSSRLAVDEIYAKCDLSGSRHVIALVNKLDAFLVKFDPLLQRKGNLAFKSFNDKMDASAGGRMTYGSL